MAENDDTDATAEQGAAQQPQQAPQIRMRVLGQYIRDLSFENVMAQKGGTGQAQPDVQVQVNMDAKKRQAENQYEVAIKLNISSKGKESGDQIFLMEIDYVGVFHVENVPDEQLHPFLLIECPRMIFPFLRRIVSDVTRDGGYPPLNLDTIDFVQLYRQEVARRKAATAQADAGTTTPQ